MHNQQPWAGDSDKPCLVTYNPITRIDEDKVVARRWFQHIVHDVRHVAWLVPLFRFIQGEAAELALRRPHPCEQPGDMLRFRARGRHPTGRGLSI